jgi:NodT family efflux transporter outer membrane factor (OMF) lipoprotein
MKRRHPVLAVALLLSGCATSELPPLATTAPVPAQFEQTASSPNALVWPSATWWQNFGDAQLSAFMAQAQANNPDLYQAAARVRQADARVRQGGAALLPTVGVDAAATSFFGRNSSTSQGETDYGAALGVSYDLDFWGRNKDLLAAANAARKASAADGAAVTLTVTAGVATTYFDFLALQDRIAIARQTLASAQGILGIVQRRVGAGYAASADLTQAQANLAAQKTLLPVLEQQALEARSALAILLGQAPEGFSIAPARLADLTIPTVQPGLPAELLVRRPDIAAAEANLVSAHADLAAARKAFLPSISLTASGGLAYPAMSAAVNTLEGFGLGLSGGATLAQTIFDGGRIQGQIDEASAREDELLGAYRSAVLASLSDVENALGNVTHLAAQQSALEEQVALSARVLTAAQRQYTAGAADFLVITDAQRSLYAATDQLADVRRARLAALVTLFKALGGGWQQSAPESSPPG